MGINMIGITTVHSDRKSPGLFIRIPKRITQEIDWKDKQRIVIESKDGKLTLYKEVSK